MRIKCAGGGDFGGVGVDGARGPNFLIKILFISGAIVDADILVRISLRAACRPAADVIFFASVISLEKIVPGGGPAGGVGVRLTVAVVAGSCIAPNCSSKLVIVCLAAKSAASSDLTTLLPAAVPSANSSVVSCLFNSSRPAKTSASPANLCVL